MSLLFTNFPSALVDGLSTQLSKWSSVHQPIIFRGHRADYQVQKVVKGLVYSRVLFIGGTPAGLVAGQTLWIVSGTNNCLVTITSVAGGLILVTGNITTNSTGGYANAISARPNYFATIRMYIATESNTYQLIGSQDIKPNADGSFSFDVHGFLKTYAELTDTFAYNTINKKQTRQGSRFNFTYSENWTGYTGPASTLSSTNQYYWANGVKQLQQKYNFNLGEFVLFPSRTESKFMSDFVKPTYFPGFPFSLSFIYSDKVAGRQLQRVEDNLNGDIGTTNLDAAQGLAVNKLMLSGAFSAREIDVWLNDAGLIDLGYVSPGYVGGTYVSPVKAIPNLESQ